MARRSRLGEAARTIARTAKRLTPSGKDAMTVAEAALGAAASLVAKKVADAVREGNGQITETASAVHRITAKTASLRPIAKRRKRAAAGRQLRSKRKNIHSARSAKRRASSR